MAADKSDLLQGTLALLILKTVEAGPMHGYAIAQRINHVSRTLLLVPQGSLYPALHRLENRDGAGCQTGFASSWRCPTAKA